jgi:predicted PurR-regulated permease PerM
MASLSFRGGSTGGAAGALLDGAHRIFATLVVVFVGIYVAAHPRVYEQGFLRLVPPANQRRAELILTEMGQTLRWWLAGQVITMAIIGALCMTGLWMVGAPFPAGLGALAGILAFIPYIGATIGLIPAALLAAAKSTSLLMGVVAVYLAIHIVEGYALAPLVQRRMVYLPPALTIAAQFLLWLLAGTLGLIVATPLTAATLALVRKLYREEV